jgi:hypothetical protein
MLSSETTSENLEEIRGIGPDAREWLNETFDVRTFAALADLPVEDLVHRIKAENKPWLRWAKNWPADAAERAAELEAEARARQPAPASGRPNEDGWDALAYYVIEFQSRQVPEKPVEQRTTVSYQGPGPETPPVPVEQDHLCDWIFEHLDSVLPAQPGAATWANVQAMPQEPHAQAVSVSQLYLFQPTDARVPLCSFAGERPRISTVAADQPFDLEAILEESTPDASANGRPAIRVWFRVRDWDTGEDTELGKAQAKALDDRPAYSARLPGISLARGKYRMQVLALAHPKPDVLGSIDIRMLGVW